IEMKTDDFMNNKKSHEVQLMSALVDGIAKYNGLNQVIDLGSGKGYLSSFLSMQCNLKVYGIDSSNTNTHGANERNRKLKKHWRAYQSQGRANVRGQVLEKEKERPEQDKEKCKANISEQLLSTNNSLQSQAQVATPDSILFETADVFTDSNTSVTSKQYVLSSGAQMQLDENISENVFLNILPADAVETDSSPKSKWKELCEEEKERRKVASLKAKASRLKEANIYSPLTSYITAETELSDIVADLEDCVMVGLHTCGDLAPNTLRIFTAKPEIKAVCSVGCCYHLLSEEHETEKGDIQGTWGFPMCQYLKENASFCGRNARMAACLALERVAVGQVLPTESLFYRAVLQVIIEEFYGVNRSDRNIGKVFSKSSSFLDYVRKSLKKLELDESKISDSLIMEYFGKYKHRMNELEAFNMLKVVLGPCIETLILLDRLCYLTEQDSLAWSGLVKLFDPIKSPRCYAVVAMKKQTFRTQKNC
ncbi:PREDICTED: methyltransferase-like protein 25, partial [Gekko japonicus]|uniref:Methyltransferase-like protein 25 n=1 Tax=Gekko japonicus TaxID=146911 RepID=A0ABM1JZQ1_GEKJA